MHDTSKRLEEFFMMVGSKLDHSQAKIRKLGFKVNRHVFVCSDLKALVSHIAEIREFGGLENTYLKGVPVENGESEYENVPSWYDCQQLCDSNPQCASFTWNYWQPSVCYLMSNVPDENYIGTSEGASSGIKSCWDSSNCKF